jgi:uncharacterized protein (DUF2235 family)
MGGRKIVLCFDGTWNHPDDEHKPEELQVETNARRLYEAVLEGPQVGGQIKWYDEGIGTHWYDRLAAGAFGLGLDCKIQEGYQYLARTHDDGDRVYLFGYSRGAYTARSLAGMIRKVGLLLPQYLTKVREAYELYRTRHGSDDHPDLLAFRRQHAREVRIHMIGAFDTVGALGVPLESFSAFNRVRYEFDAVMPDGIVDRAYHAAALDEHRAPFNISLWDPPDPIASELEQRWFIGSHADIGGGVEDRRLSDLPLRWMMEKALANGLIVDPRHVPRKLERNYLAPVDDTYNGFLGGLFAFFARPFFRPVGRTFFGNEVLDDSVLQRLEEDPLYRPRNRGVLLG